MRKMQPPSTAASGTRHWAKPTILGEGIPEHQRSPARPLLVMPCAFESRMRYVHQLAPKEGFTAPWQVSTYLDGGALPPVSRGAEGGRYCVDSH
jgi:hypothetical protein